MSTYASVANSSPVSQVRVRTLFPGFLISYVLTVSTLVTASFLWGRAGSDLIVVGLGWPHVILGFMFYANKVIKNVGSHRVNFYWLMAATVAIGCVHTFWPITTLIYVYFVFHAFRDEIFIYHQRRTGHRYAGLVFDKSGLALLFAVVLVTGAFQIQSRLAAQTLKLSYPYGAEVALCAVALVLALLALFGIPQRIFAQSPGLRYAFPAFFLVIAAMTSFRVGRFYGYHLPLFFAILVVFHYFSWYVFYLQKLGAGPPPRPAQAPVTGFDRLLAAMTTRDGFITAIVVMNVVSFAGAYSYQVLHLSARLAYIFDLKYFLYFLVFHVTMSFAPKGVPKSNKISSPAPAAG